MKYYVHDWNASICERIKATVENWSTSHFLPLSDSDSDSNLIARFSLSHNSADWSKWKKKMVSQIGRKQMASVSFLCWGQNEDRNSAKITHSHTQWIFMRNTQNEPFYLMNYAERNELNNCVHIYHYNLKAIFQPQIHLHRIYIFSVQHTEISSKIN